MISAKHCSYANLILNLFAVIRSSDPSVNVVLLEDTAAVAGVIAAASCMAISQYTGNPLADALGSLVVGTLLGCVASFIILTNVNALVGRYVHIYVYWIIPTYVRLCAYNSRTTYMI